MKNRIMKALTFPQTGLFTALCAAGALLGAAAYSAFRKIEPAAGYYKRLGDWIYMYRWLIAGAVLAGAVVFLIMRWCNKMRNDFCEQIQQKNDELMRANAAKTKFLSNVSHDMRTPMNAIIGMTALALDETDRPEKITEYLNDIHSSGEFLMGLINDVLDMDRIENGALELNPVPYEYSEFKTTICAMFRPLCARSGQNFVIEADDDIPPVCVDKVRFNQIFFNLLSNAVKFTPEGGTVTLRLHVTGRSGDMLRCRFEVQDTGIGMSEEFQQIMFSPFSQEDDKVTPELRGTGLGLSIVRSIIELMHGSISLKSRRGEGSLFTVELPLKMAEIKARPAEQPDADGVRLSGRRVLLVEDHPLNMQIARRLLEKQGVSAVCAEDGRQAVEIFRSSAEGYFDAVLMDIRMPVMNGLEATRGIRALERGDARRVPVIAMTANAFAEDVECARAAGMTAHMSKPIDPELLYKIMRECIGNAQARVS